MHVPRSRYRAYPDIIDYHYYRSWGCLLSFTVETPFSFTRGITHYYRKLPWNYFQDCNCQLSFVLPYHLELDQGENRTLMWIHQLKENLNRAGSIHIPVVRFLYSAKSQEPLCLISFTSRICQSNMAENWIGHSKMSHSSMKMQRESLEKFQRVPLCS